MRRWYGRIGGIILVLMWLVGAAGCAKQAVPVQPGIGPASQANQAGTAGAAGMGLNESKWKELGIYNASARRQFLQEARQFENTDIHFAFDSYVLDAQARAILDQKAQFLKQYSKVRVQIEGNCDDRGTTEYNLALGERRANSAYQYLINSGINPVRMTTISYGDERPLVQGNNEAAWAANRRDHFALQY